MRNLDTVKQALQSALGNIERLEPRGSDDDGSDDSNMNSIENLADANRRVKALRCVAVRAGVAAWRVQQCWNCSGRTHAWRESGVVGPTPVHGRVWLWALHAVAGTPPPALCCTLTPPPRPRLVLHTGRQ